MRQRVSDGADDLHAKVDVMVKMHDVRVEFLQQRDEVVLSPVRDRGGQLVQWRCARQQELALADRGEPRTRV